MASQTHMLYVAVNLWARLAERAHRFLGPETPHRAETRSLHYTIPEADFFFKAHRVALLLHFLGALRSLFSGV